MFLIYLFVLSQWAKAYGGLRVDECFDMKKTADNGYIMLGWSRSYHSFGDILLMKVNSYGDLQWAKDYNTGWHSEGWSIDLTSDSSYILACRVDTGLGGQYRSLFMKTDLTGNLKWTKRFGTNNISSFNHFGYMKCVREVSDGNYIFAGWDYNEFDTRPVAKGHQCVITKVGKSGNTIWAKDYTGVGPDEASELDCIQETSDGGFIACGYVDCDVTNSLNYALVVKFTSVGDIEWWKTYGHGWEDYYARWIQQTIDGGYIVACDSGNLRPTIIVMKLSPIGNTEWSNVYKGDVLERTKCVLQISGGGYIVCGMTASYGAVEGDVYLMKLFSNGNLEWAKRFGDDKFEIGTTVLEIPDGYMVSGHTSSYGSGSDDFLLISFPFSGDIPGCPVYDCSPDVHPILMDTARPGILAFTPINNTNFPVVDSSVTPVVVDICGMRVHEVSITTKDKLSVLPSVGNNFKIQYEISETARSVNLRIYDSSGRLVKILFEGRKESGIHSILWNSEDSNGQPVTSGNYYCELKFGGTITKKVIVVK